MRAKGRFLREELAGVTSDLQIDLICDRFEKDIEAGEQPDLGDYLIYIDEEHRKKLFRELLLVEWELRGDNKGAQNWRVYQARFPQYAAQIEEARLRRSPRRAEEPRSLVGGAPQVGHFVLLESIGEGSSGKVWKATDPRLQRTVAIKIPRAVRLSENALNRFLREGRAAAQLSHSGIVPVYEVGSEGDSVYIVSAYVSGRNLRDWLRGSRPTSREAATLCAQLADALDHAHERGVIHRDLKPSNIILDDERKPHITDFGLAKCANDQSDMTLEGELVGTPAYMSPEQARGNAGSADRRTDVYALGAVMYEMLTGRPPFDFQAGSIIQQVIDEDPVPPRRLQRSIPRDLETICLKAMSKSPDDRYWSAQEMAVDLRRLLDGRPIVARPPSLPERIWRWMRRKPAVVAIIGLAALLLGTLAIAGRLAADKHSMLGLRNVAITTSPAGAKLTFVPLDKDFGEPIPEKAIRPSQRSPIALEMPAGDYLIVAVLEDGRFHEVYRHVPKQAETLPGIYAHQYWKVASDKSIHLPRISIPDYDHTQEMALIPGTSRHDGFYIDCHEFSVAEYRNFSAGKDPLDKRWHKVPSDFAVTVAFGTAVALAESVGKRLPTQAEFHRAALHCEPAVSARTVAPTYGVGPVGVPSDDCTSTLPAVIGLRSNVAEWTVSRSVSSELGEIKGLPSLLDFPGRIAVGGNIASTQGEAPTSSIHPIHAHLAVAEAAVRPGLGFRCVRSIAPRFVEK